MKKIETSIRDLFLIENKSYSDNRGFFMEIFNFKSLNEMGINTSFVQDNFSVSKKGVLRGLHFQRDEWAQAKLVTVLRGEVFDVAVDLRLDSPTYKKYFGTVLSSNNKMQMYIPRGFAHGFLVLSEEAEFFYKCDNFYNPQFDGGIRYDDNEINIAWPNPDSELIISDKDKSLPYLRNLK